MQYRKSRYTPDFKLRVLAAFDAHGRRNWHKLEQEFEVPFRTILDWHRRREQIIDQAEEAHHPGRRAINAHVDMLTRQLLNTLPEKIEGAKLTDSLRALTMLNELRQLFVQEEEDREAVIERLMKQLDRYRRMKAERGEIELSSNSTPE